MLIYQGHIGPKAMWPAQEAGSEKDKPTVVAGDFNTPRPQLPEPQKLSKDEDREMAPHPATGSDGHKQRPPRFFKCPGNGAKISRIRGRTIHLHGLLKTEAIRNASSDCTSIRTVIQDTKTTDRKMISTHLERKRHPPR